MQFRELSAVPLAKQLALAQTGDKAAFSTLCRYFDPLALHYARAAHLKALSAEALSVARLAVAEAIQKFQPARKIAFSAYVASRVKYALWNLFKKERRLWQRISSYDAWEQEEGGSTQVADSVDVAELVWQRLLLQEVAIELERLSSRQQFVLKAWSLGWSLTDIAKTLSLTPQAVSQIKKRSLRRLKKRLGGMVEGEGR